MIGPFNFYLEAWLYTRKHNLPVESIKKTGGGITAQWHVDTLVDVPF